MLSGDPLGLMVSLHRRAASVPEPLPSGVPHAIKSLRRSAFSWNAHTCANGQDEIDDVFG
jgi:hypothetical protein